jgi:hypothetical protein
MKEQLKSFGMLNMIVILFRILSLSASKNRTRNFELSWIPVKNLSRRVRVSLEETATGYTGQKSPVLLSSIRN